MAFGVTGRGEHRDSFGHLVAVRDRLPLREHGGKVPVCAGVASRRVVRVVEFGRMDQDAGVGEQVGVRAMIPVQVREDDADEQAAPGRRSGVDQDVLAAGIQQRNRRPTEAARVCRECKSVVRTSRFACPRSFDRGL